MSANEKGGVRNVDENPEGSERHDEGRSDDDRQTQRQTQGGSPPRHERSGEHNERMQPGGKDE